MMNTKSARRRAMWLQDAIKEAEAIKEQLNEECDEIGLEIATAFDWDCLIDSMSALLAQETYIFGDEP